MSRAKSPMSADEPAVSYSRMSQFNREGERIVDQQDRHDRFVERADGAYRLEARLADNGKSAWMEGVERPEFNKLLSVLESGRTRVVIVWEESRVTRDAVVGATFSRLMQRIGGRLIVTDGETHTVYDFRRQRDRDAWHDAVGKSVSDSGRKSESIRRTFAEKRENMEFHGGPVGYGWRPEIKRVGRKTVTTWYVVEEEAEVLRGAARRIRAGVAVLAVANDLYDAGVRIQRRARRGELVDPSEDLGTLPLTARTLAGYLRNPRVAGLYAVRNNDGGWAVLGKLSNFPAILNEDEWRETVVAMKGGPKKRLTGQRVVHVYAGYYICFDCRKSLLRAASTDHPLWRHRLGKAASHTECSQSFSVPAPKADDLMNRIVAEYLERRDWETPEDVNDVEGLRAERESKVSALAALPDRVISGEYTEEYGAGLDKGFRRRIAEIDDALTARAARSVVIDGDQAAAEWASDDVTARRRVLAAVLDFVVVKPGRDLPLLDRLDPHWKKLG